MSIVKMSEVNKKRSFILKGLFHAEVNKFLNNELFKEGYAGVKIYENAFGLEIIIMATQTQYVLGVKGNRIKKLTALLAKRFNIEAAQLELYVQKVPNRGLCAKTQVESLKYKLINGTSVKRACYGVQNLVMDSGAQGCEIRVAGKLGGHRAKSLKFSNGKLIHSGGACDDFIDTAMTQVHLRQGVLGVKVMIMLPKDSFGINGKIRVLPDEVVIVQPKVEEEIKIESEVFECKTE